MQQQNRLILTLIWHPLLDLSMCLCVRLGFAGLPKSVELLSPAGNRTIDLQESINVCRYFEYEWCSDRAILLASLQIIVQLSGSEVVGASCRYSLTQHNKRPSGIGRNFVYPRFSVDIHLY